MAGEFIKNLDSERGPEELTIFTKDICVWECHVCFKQIKAGVDSRVQTYKRLLEGKSTRGHYHPKASYINEPLIG